MENYIVSDDDSTKNKKNALSKSNGNINEKCGDTSYDSIHTFSAIKDFVNELNSIYGKVNGKTPLDLYVRLIKHVEIADVMSVGVENYISGFKTFFINYGNCLESIEMIKTIPKDTVIRYGNSAKVYLEIQKYLYLCKNDDSQREIIRQHLLTVSATIDPSEKTLNALNSAGPILEKMGLGGTAESKFVNNLLGKARRAVENSDQNDIGSVLTNIMASGLITDVMTGLKDGVDNKTLDINKLLPALTESLPGMMGNSGGNMGENTDEEGDGNMPMGNIDMDKLIFGVQSAFSKMGGMNSNINDRNDSIEEITD